MPVIVRPADKRRRQMTPDGLRDGPEYHGRVWKYVGEFFPKRMPTGLTREGFGYLGQDVDYFVVAFNWASNTELAFMNIIEELKGNYEAAQALWAQYEDKLKAFRSSVKNDVTSLEAAARKTTESVHRMNAAYGHVIEQLNSAEMMQAVENAERLAAAMQALANLQTHKLVLSVVEQDKPA